MKKYLFLFGINALILLALSANAVMTLLSSCSPSGQCTAAVTPLTWAMAVLPIIIILGVGLYFAPRALRGLRNGQAAKRAAKVERVAVAKEAGDADEAVQSRLRRFARVSDKPALADDGYEDATAPVDAGTINVGDGELSGEDAPHWPTVAQVEDSATAAEDDDLGYQAADPDAEADLHADGADHAVGDEGAWTAEDADLPEADTDAEEPDAMPVDAGADGETMADSTQSWDELFPSFGAAIAPAVPTPGDGPWDWLITQAQVDQLRPCSQTGFPWAAATIAEMASAVIEQARADRLGDLLPEAEAWLSIATELAPAQPIDGPDADGFIGWVNDLAVHCHLVGEPVTVPTLLAQAMDRLVDRALDDRHLAMLLPGRIFPEPPEWEALAKAS